MYVSICYCCMFQDQSIRGSAQSSFQSQLAFLGDLLKPVVEQSKRDLNDAFNATLQPKVSEGTRQAVNAATGTVAKWAAPVSHGKSTFIISPTAFLERPC